MAQISCPECKRQISETAESCPKCGYKLTPEKVAEIKEKSKKVQMGCAIALLLVALPILFAICMGSQNSSTPRVRQQITSTRTDTGTVNSYKNKYREARRAYETAKSNYDQNPSNSNKQAWDDAANKLDRAYLQLEKAMGAEPDKGVTKQRLELEAFTREVKREER